MNTDKNPEREAESFFHRAEDAWRQKRVEEALDLYLAAVEADHNFHPAHRALAMIFDLVEKPELCVQHMKFAIKADPRNAEYHFQLGTFLFIQRKYDAARFYLEETLRLKPDHLKARNHLGIVHTKSGYPGKAARHLAVCIKEQPKNYKFRSNFASALINQGELQSALKHFKAAFDLNPAYALAGSNYLFALNYLPELNSKTLLKESLTYERRMRMQLPDVNTASIQAKAGKSPRRIAYVSADFRTHSVAYFIEPILRNHDRTNYEIFCYSNVAVADETTRRLRQYPFSWRRIYGLGDEEVCRIIREDDIDILIDLAGHTAENRLTLFLRRNAPVQITWLGYPATTGLSTIDYRLTDSYADPVDQDKFHSETLYRLPDGFLCYQPPNPAPDPQQPPYTNNGYITFGSFNNLPKINSSVIAVWARLLHSVPKSRLILKNKFFHDSVVCARFQKLFADHGIEPQRLELKGFTPGTFEHLSIYHRIDIALDTFPYNGTTTTCEALWMGVPVISLAGNRHASRVGNSILRRLSLDWCVVEDTESYIEEAANLANSPERLVTLRSAMRAEMSKSSLCDAARFTRLLEQSYLEIWNRRFNR